MGPQSSNFISPAFPEPYPPTASPALPILYPIINMSLEPDIRSSRATPRTHFCQTNPSANSNADPLGSSRLAALPMPRKQILPFEPSPKSGHVSAPARSNRMLRLVSLLSLLAAAVSAQPKTPLRFEISWPTPMDGHVVLIVSTAGGDPRNSVSEGLSTQQMFGVDVNNTRTAVVALESTGDNADLGCQCRREFAVPLQLESVHKRNIACIQVVCTGCLYVDIVSGLQEHSPKKQVSTIHARRWGRPLLQREPVQFLVIITGVPSSLLNLNPQKSSVKVETRSCNIAMATSSPRRNPTSASLR